MKRISTMLLLALILLPGSVQTSIGAEMETPVADRYAELSEMTTLSEIARHLYRWNLDEQDFDGIAGTGELAFHIRPQHPTLDAGDQSLYAEVYIPTLATLVQMKKTDYTIDELGVEVRSDRFKIVNVERLALPPEPVADEITIAYPVRDILTYLFNTRSQPDFPSPELSARLREAILEELGDHRDGLTGPQTVFVAPLSPVANEIWAYWQEGNLLLRWASDIELTNPAVWEHEELAGDIIDIEQQAVVAFSEAPGSNAYYTRDQIGRILYNCVVIGQKRTPVIGAEQQ